MSTKSFNWNSLFIRPDTAVSAMATKLGVTKSDLLDSESTGMATNVALMETHVIAETKKYLEDEGVSLDSFEDLADVRKGRSKTILLIKNLPYSTEESDLRDLFSKYGTIGKIVLPPTKAIAFIEYLEPQEARKGFQALAYTKFQNAPLFLEYVQIAVFKAGKVNNPEQEKKNKIEEQTAIGKGYFTN